MGDPRVATARPRLENGRGAGWHLQPAPSGFWLLPSHLLTHDWVPHRDPTWRHRRTTHRAGQVGVSRHRRIWMGLGWVPPAVAGLPPTRPLRCVRHAKQRIAPSPSPNARSELASRLTSMTTGL